MSTPLARVVPIKQSQHDQELISEVKAAYEDFSNKLKVIEIERDEKISLIIKKIENRNIEKVQNEIKNLSIN